MKITKNISTSLKGAMIAIAGSVILASTASAQVVTYSQGDLLVGFRASGGTGASTTFVYNIGSATSYRDGLFSGTVGNVGSQLSDTYGAAWFNRTDVSWGIIGVQSNANPQLDSTVVNGDPVSTIYASRSAASPSSSTAWGSPTAFTRAAIVSSATSIVGFTHTGTQLAGTFSFQTAAAGTGGFGAFVDTSATNDWANYTAGATDFGLFTGGVEGTFGTGTAYLDLYRILSTTVGASPTGTLGRGSYEGTFGIDSTGAISVIPEPSSFAALAGMAALGLGASRRRARQVQA